MRTLRWFIVGGVVFLLVALGFGVYVFMQLQNLNSGAVTEVRQSDTGEVETGTEAEVSTTSGAAASPPPIVIEEASLTPEQKALLERLGIDTSSMTITPEMMLCFEAKLGAARVEEITNGATPTIMEGISALSCLDGE